QPPPRPAPSLPMLSDRHPDLSPSPEGEGLAPSPRARAPACSVRPHSSAILSAAREIIAPRRTTFQRPSRPQPKAESQYEATTAAPQEQTPPATPKPEAAPPQAGGCAPSPHPAQTTPPQPTGERAQTATARLQPSSRVPDSARSFCQL